MKMRNFQGFSLCKRKKSHTCEEDGEHFRVCSWHLLITLKNQKNQNFEKMKENCWRYHHFTHMYQKPQSYEVQSQTEFFLSFWAMFCPFIPHLPPPNYPENKNFEKMKKASGDVIILNLSNNKHNHMMYAYSDMECNRQFFFNFRSCFALLPQYWTWKLKFQKM